MNVLSFCNTNKGIVVWGRGSGVEYTKIDLMIETVSSLHRWLAIWVVSSDGSASAEPLALGPCIGPVCS